MANLSVMETEDPRLVLLETCEKKIFSAFRRGLEASRIIAKELKTIHEQELWLVANFESFKDYVEARLQFSYNSAMRLMDVQVTMNVLEDKNIEVLPVNESQAAELSRLPVEHRAYAWNTALEVCKHNDSDLTAYAIRDSVETILRKIKKEESEQREQTKKEPAKAKAPGVKVDLSLDEGEGNGTEPKAPERIPLSEEGEKALDRLRRLCGDSVANAIENGTIKLTENQIVRWAQEENETVKNLAYYIIDMRWTFQRALNWELGGINSRTTVDELKLMAQARGGRATISHENFKITVELIAQAAA